MAGGFVSTITAMTKTAAALAQAHARLAPQADQAAESTAALATMLRAKRHVYPLPWHCSAECGRPIHQRDMYVQTSPGLKPLTRVHAACLVPRKGTDPDYEAVGHMLANILADPAAATGPPYVHRLGGSDGEDT